MPVKGDSLVVWGRQPAVGSTLYFLPKSPYLLSDCYKDASHWFGTHSGIPEWSHLQCHTYSAETILLHKSISLVLGCRHLFWRATIQPVPPTTFCEEFALISTISLCTSISRKWSGSDQYPRVGAELKWQYYYSWPLGPGQHSTHALKPSAEKDLTRGCGPCNTRLTHEHKEKHPVPDFFHKIAAAGETGSALRWQLYVSALCLSSQWRCSLLMCSLQLVTENSFKLFLRIVPNTWRFKGRENCRLPQLICSSWVIV